MESSTNRENTVSYTTTGMFANAPLPWRYDENTRNVVAADGSIVCRNGDSVYGYPEVGEGIARMANWIGVQLYGV